MTTKTKGSKYPDDLADISEIPEATALRDWHEGGLRIIILRARFSMNTYIGIPEAHPLAGHSYDDLPVDCHGGLTFADKGDGEILPKGYFWYGYDYCHMGDYLWMKYRDESSSPGHKWTIGEVVKDAGATIYDFKKLQRLTERVHEMGVREKL